MVNTAEHVTALPARIHPEGRRWCRAGGILSTLALAGATVRFLLPPVPEPFSMPRWFAAAAAGLGVATWAMVVWSRSRPMERTVLGAVVLAAWGACVALLVVAAGIAFDVVGTAMWVAATLTGQSGPITLALDPAGSVTRALALGGGVAWGIAALSAQRRSRGGCPGCGRRSEGPGHAAIPLSARIGRWAAYPAGVLAFGYGSLKAHWGLGGDIGLSRPGGLGETHLWSPGLGDTAVLAAIGVALALALVRPWGRRLPRWLPIAGAFVGCAMLIPVGLLGSYATLPDVLAGRLTESPMAPWVYAGIYPWFLAWGLALAAAAWSYAYRTRGRCGRCGRGEA